MSQVAKEPIQKLPVGGTCKTCDNWRGVSMLSAAPGKPGVFRPCFSEEVNAKIRCGESHLITAETFGCIHYLPMD
jgi:hypothetical protein